MSDQQTLFTSVIYTSTGIRQKVCPYSISCVSSIRHRRLRMTVVEDDVAMKTDADKIKPLFFMVRMGIIYHVSPFYGRSSSMISSAVVL